MADQVLQDIKDRIDVADLLGSYIQIKRSGTNFKAVCPFHNEKSASLMISPAKQIWHCFGCGEGGDIFKFIMRYENVEFKEALKILADKAGVVLPAYSQASKQGDDKRKLYVRINTFAAKYYHKLLLEDARAEHALNYLLERGLTKETLIEWQIGWAPNDFHALEKELVKKGVAISDLVGAGVSVKSDRGDVYDRFRDRVTFPIVNYFGEVVGFTARTLEKDAQSAKYINSPETESYNKSKVMFGLYKAKEAIRRSGEVVIVEGQMDVISAHQAGFSNTVATSGTALTLDQLRAIKRLADTAKFCFDADTAGKTATLRAGQLALQLGLKVKNVILPSGKDPDELIKNSKDAWSEAVASAIWLIEFYIKEGLKKYEFNSIEQKQYASSALASLLKQVSDPVEQTHYIREVSQDYNISENDLKSAMEKASSVSIEQESVVDHELDNNPTLELEKQIFGGLLVVPEFLLSIKNELKAEDFKNEEISKGVMAILEGQDIVSSDFLETLAKETEFMVESQLEYLEGNKTALVIELQKSFYLLKLAGIKQHLQQITVSIKHAENNGQSDLVKSLGQEFNEFSLLRMQYEAKL